MDYFINWTQQANEDVESIIQYIAKDSPTNASLVANQILSAVNKLEQMPFSGRLVPEIKNDSIREKFVFSFRIIYRIENQQISILGIVHGKRILNLDVD